jgi:hypothetical protein
MVSSLVLSAALGCAGTFSSVVAQQPLPDAGQELCYDEVGDSIDCGDTDCPGQDADYTMGCPLDASRYEIVNGGTDDIGGMPFDDVVKDHCTGLMWTRNHADYSGDGLIDLWSSTDDAVDWETALAYCDDLVLTTGNGLKREQDLDGGDPDDTIVFDDWRLANVREMLSIQNWDRDPAHDGTVWFGASSGIWTSTSRVDVFSGGFCGAPGVDSFNTAWIYESRGGTSGFGSCKRGKVGFHPVRTMLPGDAGAGGGGAGSDGGERGGGAGPVCATENGDDNGDGGRDLSDAIYKLSFLFQGGGATVPFCTPAGPKAEGCAAENGDDNGDGGIDLSDAIYKLAFLFQGGPDPVAACPNIGGPETSCNDNVDNDIDGDTDCADDDCVGTPSCTETSCNDSADNDGDGDTDCDDSDCIGIDPCPGPEICSNSIDDDLDGAIDCTDQDCANSSDCYVEGGTGLPDTGQRTCYSFTGRIIPCPAPGEAFYGQDGSHDTGCGSLNRFTDNGDGTVTDGCTGLMWQQADDGVGRLWCEALVYCEGLELGGHTDWRMPNAIELESLVHYGFQNPPMIDPIFVDTEDTPGVYYWSSTSKYGSGNTRVAVYSVEFNEGSLHCCEGDKDVKMWPVRAVRGP